MTTKEKPRKQNQPKEEKISLGAFGMGNTSLRFCSDSNIRSVIQNATDAIIPETVQNTDSLNHNPRTGGKSDVNS